MTISKEYPHINFKAVTIKSWHDGKPINKCITGHRNCQTLLALQDNLKCGFTALDMGAWTYLLSDYIHILCREYNLEIETRYEAHDGGNHERYFLQTPIEILGIEGVE